MSAREPGWSTDQVDTINAVLQRSTEKYGDRQFLEFLGETYSFAELNRTACRLANGLKGLGVSKGQTVVTILDNSADAVVIWFAINKLGAISVPVNTALKGDFLRHQVSDADAAVVIAEHDYAERVAGIADKLPKLETLVYRGTTPDLVLNKQLLPWASLLSDDTSEPGVDVQPGDLAMLIYTGGTTGPSKGCMISHNYTCSLARQMLMITNRDETTITWTPLPLFHFNAVATSVLCNMMVGAQVAIYPRFSVSNFWPEIERTGANDVGLLAAMMPMLAGAPDNDAMKRCYGQIKGVWGAPFPEPVQQAWKKRFGVTHTIVGGFGLSECSLPTILPFGTPMRPNSSGKRNTEYFDVRIVDDHDNELPSNTPGEIIVRPRKPHIMFEGYWKRPEDTLKVMRNMWFHTGDIGMFDEDDYFYFLDRKKDYLRRRGENISSFEVESAFLQHSAVDEVAAHAVLSDLGEDELKVTITLKPDTSLSEVDLCHWAAEQMPYYAVPRYIEFRSALPKSPLGRVYKFQLRDEGVTTTTWDREKAGFKLNKR
ncbi:TPA: AMP-binding protein [Pseudomonas aeruginosa]|uniref:AMP-binding protein n=1 Tax=Pseudomonas aeruginosa TaxID=287 RepID=UPI00071B856C|nr:AMP-binding protein [Pseudomonas aeruginosa]KSQ25028.1 ATP-dependent acyl-CoA ligase [Pseudomonas aeruginosa]MCO1687912.1 ATP-dependent acyl-CoA ligase [Pseudomonas aeruginosa]MCO1778586.1 ATP-dependent acyl-CoA ligase [Pseudomonas aeruginosa]MCO1790105.1 ATP-dependent acyl-CoA ligase [Pseudomonas aeruginosa]MCO1802417.1 ATP-dependent acyl-CoA ligase [Pseudomonas aeruginosa]